MTLFDYSVIGIIIFFTFVGIVRGFIGEFFSLINWVGSGMLSVWLTPHMNKLVSLKISQPLMSQMVSSFLVFIICIIGLSIITSSISSRIDSKVSKSTNITLGLAFGFTKGFLLCSLVFTTIICIFGETEDLSIKSGPQWLQASQTYKPLSFGAYLILPFVDSALGKINKDVKEEKTNDVQERKKNNVEILKDKVDDKVIDFEDLMDEKGYRKDQVDKMNQLINSI